MKNGEHWDLMQIQKKLSEKVMQIENEDERKHLLNIVVDLGKTLESFDVEPEPDRLKYFQP